MRFGVGAAVLVSLMISAGCGRQEPKQITIDFETEADLDRLTWNCHTRFLRTDEYATSGSWSLHCWLPQSDWPGISFLDFPKDWSEAGSLTFDFYNPSTDTLTLVVRVDDEEATPEHADRFNQSFVAPPGLTSVLVLTSTVALGPEARALDLTRIKQFLIFLSHPGRPVDFYLDNLELR